MSLEFRHIAHAYGEVEALRDVSFTALSGRITCLLGSSGCGKSTLLSLAAGLIDLQRGSVWLDGQMLAEPGEGPPPEKRSIGLVFQEGALFPHMTAADNVAFGLSRSYRDAVEPWLCKVGLSGLGKRYPHELSGGQKQRAALARAIAPGPRVLLMDEPFASVDIVLRRRLRRDCRLLLRERDTTTLLVTHDPDEAIDIADQIVVMEAGQVVQTGTPVDLQEHPVSASIGAMFDDAQIVGARIGDGELQTPFGVWPLSSIAGPLPGSADLELLVQASRIELRANDAGLRVRDHRPRGARDRVVLTGENGAELDCDAHAPVNPEKRYSAMPMPRSVRAFPAE